MQKTIFQKNIDALKSNTIRELLLKHNVKENIQIKNTNGYNLEYNGMLLHNPTSPLGEAQKIFETLDNSPESINIIYGIGLGYFFQYSAIHSVGKIILYEPNLDILKTAFTLVDFSKELSSDNVFVAIDKTTLEPILRNHMGYGSYPALYCLPSYKEIFKEQLKEEQKKLIILTGAISLDCAYTKNRYYPVSCKILNNIPYLIDEPPLSEIKDIYKNETAVVVSAGPTLQENLETLKKYQDNVIILCVGPAYRALVNAGIKPDFLCIIEDRNCSGQINGLDLSETNLIIEPSTHPVFHKLKTKKTFLHISDNLPPNKIWANLAELDTKEYYSRGTVSYCALNCARILGCKNIILVGQDLAFIDNQLYSKDSAYGDLKLKYNENTKNYEVVVDNYERLGFNLSNNKEKLPFFIQKTINRYKGKITTIKSITGELIPTEAVYATFANTISKYPTLYPDRNYINTSMKGALLDGFKNIPLETALQNSSKIEKKELNISTSIDKNFVINKLDAILNDFITVETQINDNKKLISRLELIYKRNKSLSKEILTGVKKLVDNYIQISINYAQKNPIFDFITKKEQMNFETCLNQATNMTIDNILKIIYTQNEFLKYATEHVNEVKDIIKTDIETLKTEE